MRLELFCLIGVLLLALLAGQSAPGPAESPAAGPVDPQSQRPAPQPVATVRTPPENWLSLQPAAPLGPPLAEIHEVCRLDADQLARARDRMELARHERATWERALWKRLEQARRASRQPLPTEESRRVEQTIRRLRARCDQLGREEIRDLLALLTAEQRRDWQVHRLVQALWTECDGLALTGAQRRRVETIGRRHGRTLPADRLLPGPEEVSDAMERVYLDVLDRAQRMRYAALVAQRTRQRRLARAAAEGLDSPDLDEPPN